jgi:hypothetical protein
MSSAQRSGSAMSAKQMARAATAGRRITFCFLAAKQEVEGYLVGMDDYHWFVATPIGHDVETMLIHKGSADLIKIDRVSSLEDEPSFLKDAVRKIGGSFFKHCTEKYFGTNQ